MPEKLMIDSGAFSVWNKGLTIDLDEYLRYCKAHPSVSVFVNLDVIPPKGLKLTNEVKEETCKRGWDNFMKMIRVLPMEKVVPVFHRGEDIKWLEKYIDFGCPYVGISPRFDFASKLHTQRRIKYLDDCRKVVVGSDGKPIVKTHGFAVTNHLMMMAFPWYSVDSATWTQQAAWGSILVPHRTNGKWDFTRAPLRVFTSINEGSISRPDDPSKDNRLHLLLMEKKMPSAYQVVIDWLEENGMRLGKHKIVEANGRKPKKIVEKWYDKAKTKIVTVEEPGVVNSDQARRWINVVFYHRCNEVLDVENLYLAGNGPCVQVEKQIRYRLRSFAEGGNVTSWIANEVGTYDKTEKFPFDEDLNFSFKAEALKAEAGAS